MKSTVQSSSTRLRELIDEFESGSRPKGGVKGIRDGIPSLGGEHLGRNGGFHFERIRFVPPAFAKSMSRGHVKMGDILVVKDGATTGKVSLVRADFPYPDAVINEHLFRLKLKEDYYPAYAFYFLFSLTGQQQILSDFRGAAQGGISQGFVDKVLVPEASFREQQRIVAEIEKQFTRMEVGVAALRRVQVNLKRYRAAVLQAACEGRLVPTEAETARLESRTYERATELLRRLVEHPREPYASRKKGRAFTQEDAEGLPPLPEGWAWAGMRQVGEVQLGRQRAPQHHNGKNMRPYLRVANVFEARLDLADVNTMNFTLEEFQKYRLLHGDILLNEGQTPELVGRPAMFRNEIPNCCYQKTLLRFRAYAGLLPAFALTVFRSYMHSGRFTRSASITTNIAHLTAEKFVEIEFPLPPFAEQKRIVAEVERRLSVSEELNALLFVNLRRAIRLRHSILQNAFAGKL